MKKLFLVLFMIWFFLIVTNDIGVRCVLNFNAVDANMWLVSLSVYDKKLKLKLILYNREQREPNL
jgi:hypothetical protein